MTRVIIADDDRDVVEVLAMLLECKGIEVSAVAHNGKEAFDAVKENQSDVLLLDINMPVYDGYWTLEKIKMACPDVKIIILSGEIIDNVRNKISEFGNFTIHSKPFDIDELVKDICDAV